MKLTLMINGSASQLALILANLPEGAAVDVELPPMPSATAILNQIPATTALPPIPVAAADDDDGPVDANAPALDKDGLPWDARIHAKTRVTVADGTWRKRRGVDDTVVTAVEAELRTRLAPPMPAQVPATVPQIAPTTAEVVVQPPVLTIAPPMPLPEPVVTAVPPMPAPEAPPMPLPVAEVPVAAVPVSPAPATHTPAQPAAPGHLDIAQFMQHLSEQMTKRDPTGMPLVTADILASTANEISDAFIAAGHLTTPLGSITDIAGNQQMIDYAIAVLTRDGRW